MAAPSWTVTVPSGRQGNRKEQTNNEMMNPEPLEIEEEQPFDRSLGKAARPHAEVRKLPRRRRPPAR